MLFKNILDTIGGTPLVKLNRVGAHLPCNLYGKCEFFNPGGSVKDRIGFQMVVDAEAEGRITPGDTLIEPTSGNTGIGLALAGAVKGYRVIITMPEKMSREKQVVLEALGAEIIRTPTEAAWDAKESHIGVAKTLVSQLPNAHILDQYANPSNPQIHYQATGREILDDLQGDVSMVVIGAGTGGTISGVAKRIKEAKPDCLIVGADPVGSILAGPGKISSYKVEGIGYDFIPDVLNRELVDKWVKTTDRESFLLARRLIKEEGLLCGGSSGSALFAALREAKRLKPGQNCVVLLPDGVRNYMTKFVDDKWMAENRFTGMPLVEGKVEGLLAKKPELVCLPHKETVQKAITTMKSRGISQIPITMDERLVGVITEVDILNYLSSGEYSPKNQIGDVMDRSVHTVRSNTPINVLQELLMDATSAVVIDEQSKPLGIVTKIDLVGWLADKMASDL
jgi:cystathionine beta-synthase